MRARTALGKAIFVGSGPVAAVPPVDRPDSSVHGTARVGGVDVTHGAGTVALVPGGLFELILPNWLFAKGFASHQIDAS